ncbi:Long-chain-alcohol O-fatty-acyltransferase [Bertholletia excelsa]
MEGEIKNFIFVLATVLASLYYCYKIKKLTPKGKRRLSAIFPVVCLFLYLPLTLHTLHLGATTSFLIGWLATFKLLLLAFDKGPLSPQNTSISFFQFTLLACLPVNNINTRPSNVAENPDETKSKTDFQSQKSPPDSKIREISDQRLPEKYAKFTLYYAVQVVIVVVLTKAYEYKDYVHPKLMMLLYCLHIYVALEILLAVAGALFRTVAQVELEPPFDEPYLSTSLQDFWGRRWNLVVSNILRLTVYDPVKSFSSRWMGRRWASVPAVLATFFVSGLMHEMILYNIGRMRPTGEMMCFFLIHGACLALEFAFKKALNGKFKQPRLVSTPLVLFFVMITSLWLFMPPSLRCKADDMARRETAAYVEFVKDKLRDFRAFLV